MYSAILDKAAKLFPNVSWWIKADGVDVVSGLGEFVSGKWTGDVDLNDGEVQQMYTTYSHRLGFVSELGLTRRKCHEVEEDLLEIEEAHKDDLSIVTVSVSESSVHTCTYRYTLYLTCKLGDYFCNLL